MARPAPGTRQDLQTYAASLGWEVRSAPYHDTFTRGDKGIGVQYSAGGRRISYAEAYFVGGGGWRIFSSAGGKRGAVASRNVAAQVREALAAQAKVVACTGGEVVGAGFEQLRAYVQAVFVRENPDQVELWLTNGLRLMFNPSGRTARLWRDGYRATLTEYPYAATLAFTERMPGYTPPTDQAGNVPSVS